MGKIEVTDECLTPEKYTYVKYSGKNPWDVAGKITDMIRPFFHVSASGTNNHRLNWDITDDVRTFYTLWWVKRRLSRHSDMWIEVKLQGKQHKDTKVGSFSIQLSGTNKTAFEGWGPLLKPVWYIYSYLFYNRVRREWIRKCQGSVYSFKSEIKKAYGLEESGAPSGSGVYG